ncbi:T9SS type A sorting domain-containing protein [Jiulongibacter sp. NS-SX5]|uniref:T9SS type A sorting domain-containing protein n=1 Tax=Jiulongibacter sp. NS-SX5 TaxID=3463854 RepID=UPI004058F922
MKIPVVKLKPIFTLFLLAFSLFYGNVFSQSLNLSSSSGFYCYGDSSSFIVTSDANFEEDETFFLFRKNADESVTELGQINDFNFNWRLNQSATLFVQANTSGIKSNELTVNIDAFPGLFIQYDAEPFCEGFGTPIEIYTGLISGDNISWLKDGILIPGASESSYKAMESGIYTAQVQRGSCTYTVGGRASITSGEMNKARLSSSTPQQACEGYAVQINASFPALESLSMQWFYEGDTIFGATSSNFSATESGQYSLALRQGSCTSKSDPFLVNIGTVKAGDIDTYPLKAKNGEITICENTNLRLTAEGYENEGNLSYYWLKDGKGIPGARSKSVTIQQPGLYRFGLKQGNCESLSEPILVKTGTIEAISLSRLNDDAYCAGSSVQVLPFVENSDIIRGAYNLSLYKDNEVLKNIDFFYDLGSLQETGSYHIAGNFGNDICLISSDTLDINFDSNTVSFDLADNFEALQSCIAPLSYGSGIQLKFETAQTQFSWLLNGSELPNENQKEIGFEEAGRYQLKAEISENCTYLSNPIEVKFGTPAINILTDQNGNCAQEISFLSFQLGEENTSYLTSEGNDFFSSASISWSKEGQVRGSDKRLNINTSGTYELNIQAPSCEVLNEDIQLQLTEINTQLSPVADTLGICINGGFALITSNEITDSYQWVNDQLTASSDSFTVRADRLGSYKVWIEKNGCAKFSETKTIIENVELPSATLSGGGQIEIGQSTNIQVDFTGPGPWTFSTPSSGSITAESNPYIFSVSPLSTTTYSVTTVENPCGFGEVFGSAEVIVIVLSAEKEKTIHIYPNPATRLIKISGSNAQEINFQLLEMSGRQVDFGKYSDRGINIENLPSGSYILNLIADGEVSHHRIIKQ